MQNSQSNQKARQGDFAFGFNGGHDVGRGFLPESFQGLNVPFFEVKNVSGVLNQARRGLPSRR